MIVEYIGTRPFWKDTVYRSGLTFETGQQRDVPPLIARKLLKHPDVFRESVKEQIDIGGKTEDTGLLIETAKQREADKQEHELSLIDQIQCMDKDELKQFAITRYQLSLDKRKALNEMRTEVAALVTRFGAD
jgi:hypothetical protein